MQNPLIAGRIFNTPLLIHPGKADAIIHGLSSRLGVDVPAPAPGMFTSEPGEKKAGGYRVVGCVGVIEVFGILAHRGRMEANSSYVLGYQDVARMLDSALADSQVKAVVIIFHTPGGEVSGAFDLADKIFAARSAKPIHGCVSDMAASAGYLAVSACSEISVSQTGYTGSIGVVMRHVDMSVALKKKGYEVTNIFAGAHKVDGNPFEPLPEAVRVRWQAEIIELRDMFIGVVARNRNISTEQVRATEALCYMGAKGVEMGLADRVETPDELISRLQAEHGGASSRHFMTTQEATMAGKEKPAEEVTQAASEEQAATLVAAKAKSHDEGRKAGAEEERTRITAILDSDEAKGREAQARHFAFNTDMAADDVKTALAAGATAVPASAKSPLDAAMAGEDQPQISAEGEGGELSASEQILSDFNAATGRTSKE